MNSQFRKDEFPIRNPDEFQIRNPEDEFQIRNPDNNKIKDGLKGGSTGDLQIARQVLYPLNQGSSTSQCFK